MVTDSCKKFFGQIIGSDSSGSIRSCGISPSLSTHQFKAVTVLHSVHLDHRDGCTLPISLRHEVWGVRCIGKTSLESPRLLKNYHLAIVVVHIFIPWVLIAILYIIIFLKLKSQKIRPGEQSANVDEQRQQRERNVLKVAIATVLGFAICWLPVITRHLVFFTSDIEMSCGLQYFSSVAFLMANANCAMNPSICFIFSRNYREGLKTLLREIINSAEVMILLYDNWEDQST